MCLKCIRSLYPKVNAALVARIDEVELRPDKRKEQISPPLVGAECGHMCR
jgi:hypothetical protein